MPSFHQDHPGSTIRLSDEQFSELKALLQPGYELATLMLADYQAQQAAAAEAAEHEAKHRKRKHDDA